MIAETKTIIANNDEETKIRINLVWLVLFNLLFISLTTEKFIVILSSGLFSK